MVRRRTAALLAALILAAGSAAGEIAWPEETGGQRMLKQYVMQADTFLTEQGEAGINSLFEAYPGFEVFGITDLPGAETPEKVEITAKLFHDTINSLEVRVSDLPRFPRIAASFIQALSPETITREQALAAPTERMRKAAAAPETSFEDQPENLNGESPYIYYAYHANQYHDGVNWIQMTIIFPMEGAWDGGSVTTGTQTTRAPDTWSGADPEYEGSHIDDDYSHYEFFMTPTPEPDSAAAEEGF